MCSPRGNTGRQMDTARMLTHLSRQVPLNTFPPRNQHSRCPPPTDICQQRMPYMAPHWGPRSRGCKHTHSDICSPFAPSWSLQDTLSMSWLHRRLNIFQSRNHYSLEPLPGSICPLRTSCKKSMILCICPQGTRYTAWWKCYTCSRSSTYTYHPSTGNIL
jgi:hypothetical protein